MESTKSNRSEGTSKPEYASFLQRRSSNQSDSRSDVIGIPMRIQARLNAAQAARVLGFVERDIAVLIQNKLLKPLGNPAPNATKYFAACEIEQLAGNPEWLDSATQVVYDYWKGKNSCKVANSLSNSRTMPESAFAA